MPDTKPKMGQKIDLREAQGMIEEYLRLSNNTDTTIKENVKSDPVLQEKMNVFVKKREYNAFVFTKELLMRFFDGSEEDDDYNPQSANFLVVILGAHENAKTVNDQKFEAGSFTVLTAGCTRRTESKDGKKVIKFYPLSTPKAANEYPPQTTVTLKPMGENKWDGNGFEYLEVI